MTFFQVINLKRMSFTKYSLNWCVNEVKKGLTLYSVNRIELHMNVSLHFKFYTNSGAERRIRILFLNTS